VGNVTKVKKKCLEDVSYLTRNRDAGPMLISENGEHVLISTTNCKYCIAIENEGNSKQSALSTAVLRGIPP
jgi:hypothetical protein